MSIRETVEGCPVHIALLAAAAQVTLGQHANLAAERHQLGPIVIDPVVLVVSLKLRV